MGKIKEDLLNLLATRRGHFLLEPGHHGDLWLDLELVCQRPRLLRPMVAELASRMRQFDVEVICGPLVEGAFVGLMAASDLDVAFVYSERYSLPSKDDLFTFGYRIPQGPPKRCS